MEISRMEILVASNVCRILICRKQILLTLFHAIPGNFHGLDKRKKKQSVYSAYGLLFNWFGANTAHLG